MAVEQKAGVSADGEGIPSLHCGEGAVPPAGFVTGGKRLPDRKILKRKRRKPR